MNKYTYTIIGILIIVVGVGFVMYQKTRQEKTEIIAPEITTPEIQNEILEEEPNVEGVLMIRSTIEHPGCVEVSEKGSGIWEHYYIMFGPLSKKSGRCGE